MIVPLNDPASPDAFAAAFVCTPARHAPADWPSRASASHDQTKPHHETCTFILGDHAHASGIAGDGTSDDTAALLAAVAAAEDGAALHIPPGLQRL